MKFVPLNNNPNVSQNRFASVSPSIKLNSSGYPCISWITKKNGYNEIHYKYWSGTSWSAHGTVDLSSLSRAKPDVLYSPNALSLANGIPTIVFAKRDINNNNLLSCATVESVESGNWVIDELLVDYNPLWIGVLSYTHSIPSYVLLENSDFLLTEDGYFIFEDDALSSLSSLSSMSSWSLSSGHSSSSSSSSGSLSSSSSDFENNVVVTYGEDYFIRVYFHTPEHTWALLGSLDLGAAIEDLSSLKITIAESKVGIAYSTGTIIKYNFFDALTQSWSFVSFQNFSASSSALIVDFSVSSLFSTINYMYFVWSINATSSSSLKYGTVSEFGVETSATVETTSTTAVLSNGFMPSGYRKVSLCLDNSNSPKIFATGAISALFSNGGVTWSKTIIDISGSSTYTPNNVISEFDSVSGLVKISFDNNKNINYYEESADIGFEEIFPQITVLSEKRLYISDWASGILNGSQVFGSYKTMAFDMTKERNKVGVFVDKWEDPFICTSSSSSSIDSSSSSFSSSSSSSSERGVRDFIIWEQDQDGEKVFAMQEPYWVTE